MEKNDVFETLRFKIITNTLHPGEILNEKDLMAEYGIGRSPLRDVLLKLQEEGLIKTIPRFGSMVTQLDLSEIRELVEVRKELEGFAASLAAQRITVEQLCALEDILETAAGETTEALMGDSIADYFDTRFHNVIYEAAHNRKLERILQDLHIVMLRLWFHLGFQTIRFSAQSDTMFALLDALEHKDPGRARVAMADHIDLYAARVKEKIV